jgi:rfaE bifunctional protein nucleotidyltransferase chain/domain
MRFFVVSNQSGIGRGFLTSEQVSACNRRLRELLGALGIIVEAFRICPHRPEDGCACRKPRTGMWEALRKEYLELDPRQTVMVGDKDADMVFGKNIGCLTARLLSDAFPMGERGDIPVCGLYELADILLAMVGTGIVCSRAAASAFVQEQRGKGRTVVTTNGAFDLLHPGHVFLLSEARRQGDVLIVGVNSDVSVKRYKGAGRPIEPQDARGAKVAAYADRVFIFDDDDPRAWLRELRPDVHVNASTYGEECVEAPVLREIGARLVLVPVRPELGSTSAIIARRSPHSA